MKVQLVAMTTGVAIVLILGILATSVTFVAEQKAYAQGSSGNNDGSGGISSM